eukprot:752413-Hanusia_phi.AAC.2
MACSTSRTPSAWRRCCEHDELWDLRPYQTSPGLCKEIGNLSAAASDCTDRLGPGPRTRPPARRPGEPVRSENRNDPGHGQARTQETPGADRTVPVTTAACQIRPGLSDLGARARALNSSCPRKLYR